MYRVTAGWNVARRGSGIWNLVSRQLWKYPEWKLISGIGWSVWSRQFMSDLSWPEWNIFVLYMEEAYAQSKKITSRHNINSCGWSRHPFFFLSSSLSNLELSSVDYLPMDTVNPVLEALCIRSSLVDFQSLYICSQWISQTHCSCWSGLYW